MVFLSTNNGRYTCPATRDCGGCPGLSDGVYGRQLMRKFEPAKTASLRLFTTPEISITAAPNPIEYRRRIRLKVTAGEIHFFKLF